MIPFLLTVILFFVVAFLVMAPLFVFIFRKELKEIYKQYKDEQKRIP